jgi:DNA replication protein DnaT
MRIRTVKPEFWAHPITGRWRGELQALAIGLLNLADDEGFFRADPMLVRAALRPFDDSSKNVLGMIQELSRALWIEVREHQKHGPVAVVCHFSVHQRIDKPQASKLRHLFDESAFVERSKSLPGTLLEGSRLDQV